MKWIAVVVLAAGLLLGCVTTTKKPTRRRAPAKFACANQVASFTQTNGDVQDGVVLSCVGTTPFIRRWVTRLSTGYRRDASHSLTPAQFSFLWMNVGSTGWYRQRVCKEAAAAGKPETGAPPAITTVFRVTQGRVGISLQCQGKKWPRAFSQLYRILTRAGKRYAPWVTGRMPR